MWKFIDAEVWKNSVEERLGIYERKLGDELDRIYSIEHIFHVHEGKIYELECAKKIQDKMSHNMGEQITSHGKRLDRIERDIVLVNLQHPGKDVKERLEKLEEALEELNAAVRVNKGGVELIHVKERVAHLEFLLDKDNQNKKYKAHMAELGSDKLTSFKTCQEKVDDRLDDLEKRLDDNANNANIFMGFSRADLKNNKASIDELYDDMKKIHKLLGVQATINTELKARLDKQNKINDRFFNRNSQLIDRIAENKKNIQMMPTQKYNLDDRMDKLEGRLDSQQDINIALSKRVTEQDKIKDSLVTHIHHNKENIQSLMIKECNGQPNLPARHAPEKPKDFSVKKLWDMASEFAQIKVMKELFNGKPLCYTGRPGMRFISLEPEARDCLTCNAKRVIEILLNEYRED